MNQTPEGRPIPTQRDVARRASVSTATVSRFINQKGYISPLTSRRIDRAIQELRYKPNLLARSLKVRSSKIIGLIFPDIENPFFITLVETAEEVAQKYGYSVVLCNTKNTPVREIDHLEILKGKQADGYIIIPSITSGSALAELLKGEKVVLLDRSIECDAEHVVVKLNNAKGVGLAIDYLAGLGHTRIATILVPTNVTTGQERMVAYRTALRDKGLSYDPNLERNADFSVESAFQQTRELLALRDRPTALLPMSGPTTLGALKAIQESEIRVPDELSVIGFDEFQYAELLKPSLTTIAQPARQFGTMGIQILLQLLRGERPEPKTIVLDPILIKRDSCRSIC
jgi:DNA-binding LacI/PurR family transcriptional regulator